MRVERIDGDTRTPIADGAVAPNGLLAAPERPFPHVAPLRFTPADRQGHCHLPFEFTAFGFSCFPGAE